MTAKTRPYYVELGKADALAGKPHDAKFSKDSWQAFAYKEGFADAERQKAGEAPKAPQFVKPLVPDYNVRLRAEILALREKHGYVKVRDEDGTHWRAPTRVRPQVVKKLAKLKALVELAEKGKQTPRVELKHLISADSRMHSHSHKWLAKDGKYGPSVLANDL